MHDVRIGLDADAAAAAAIEQRGVAELPGVMRADIDIARPLDPKALEDIEHGKVLAMLRVHLAAEPLVFEVRHQPSTERTNSSETAGATWVIQS
jgi:hypothetical protein